TAIGARKALELDGVDMDGRFLRIKPCRVNPSASSAPTPPALSAAHPTPTTTTTAAPHPKATSDLPPPQRAPGSLRAYVGNLAWSMDEAAVAAFFPGCSIASVRLARNPETGRHKGYGHVDFEDEESLERAIERNQQVACGRPVKVAYAVASRGDGGGGGGGGGGGAGTMGGAAGGAGGGGHGGGGHGGGGHGGAGAGGLAGKMGEGGDAMEQEHEGARGRKGKGRKKGSEGCFVCGHEGHKSFDCPEKHRKMKRHKSQ
ncbi:unnamed protein product, partial [Closterium sp. NIES-53]